MSATRSRALSSIRARLRVVDFTRWLAFLRRDHTVPSFQPSLSFRRCSPSFTTLRSRTTSEFVSGLQRSPSPRHSLRRLLNLPCGSANSEPHTLLCYALQEVDTNVDIPHFVISSWLSSHDADDISSHLNAIRILFDHAVAPQVVLVYASPASVRLEDNTEAVVLFLENSDVRTSFMVCVAPDRAVLVVQRLFQIARAVIAHGRIQPLSLVRARLRIVSARAYLSRDTRQRFRRSAQISRSWTFTGSGWLHHSHKRASSLSILLQRDPTTCSALKHLGTRLLSQSPEQVHAGNHTLSPASSHPSNRVAFNSISNLVTCHSIAPTTPSSARAEISVISADHTSSPPPSTFLSEDTNINDITSGSDFWHHSWSPNWVAPSKSADDATLLSEPHTWPDERTRSPSPADSSRTEGGLRAISRCFDEFDASLTEPRFGRVLLDECV
jgi:hypothetical protein